MMEIFGELLSNDDSINQTFINEGILGLLINEINKKDAITVIMVSHDVKTAIKSATHILHLENKTCYFGKTSEYVKSSAAMQFMSV